MPKGSALVSFVRCALGLRFEMRYDGEVDWWAIDAQDVAETLAGYYDSLPSCLDQLREGRELRSPLAYFRVRR